MVFLTKIFARTRVSNTSANGWQNKVFCPRAELSVNNQNKNVLAFESHFYLMTEYKLIIINGKEIP